MKSIQIVLLFAASFHYSCTSQPSIEAVDCSINFDGVLFTKSLHGAVSNTKVKANRLILQSAPKSDIFNDPDGKLSNHTAPVLLTTLENNKAFTFTAKLTPEFNSTYDAAAIYLYDNKGRYFKFAFEMDERGKTRIVTVRTIGTSDDNNHDVIEQSYVYLKISSDTKTIGFYYSKDNLNWQLVRLFRNDFPSTTWMGLSTQSPVGNGSAGVFEDIHLSAETVKDFRLGN